MPDAVLAEVIPPEVAMTPAERYALRLAVAAKSQRALDRDRSMRAVVEYLARPTCPWPGVPLLNPRTK